MNLIYSPLKIFHYTRKLDSLPASTPEVLPPIHIRLKPTNACTHQCRYCAYLTDGLQLGQDMNRAAFIPRERMMELIEDFGEIGVKAVTFSGGGEPFCYPYLGEAAGRIADAGIRLAALTNGSLLEGALADLFAHRATWLRVSIDGWDDASYSDYRRVPVGEFSRIMNNLEEFKRLGGPCRLGVSIIVDRQNADHVYDLVKTLRDRGVDSAKISPCIVSNEGRENVSYHQPIFDRVKEQASAAIRDLAGPGFEIFDSYHRLDDKFAKDYSWCPYLQILTVIGADLNVYACQDKAYNLENGLIGSLANQRFRDFWMNDKSKFFRINPSRDCNHHCVANGKNQLVLQYLGLDDEHGSFV